MSVERRAALEADRTYQRILELRLRPVAGRFDAAHLRQIHRRIFQDLPGLGFAEVTPGRYRPPVVPGGDWIKTRRLETVGAVSVVAYSRMDAAAVGRLEQVLEGVDASGLACLDADRFTQAIGALYAELDYLHPFGDGNSRTLREFTRELAQAAGYTLAWERFAASPAGRDVLYIARDRSVNAIALAQIQDPDVRRDVVLTMDRFERNRDLPELLRDAVRPVRAVAFERLSKVEAIGAHPELAEAFEALHAAARYFETKLSDRGAEAQAQALQAVRAHVQQRLDAGHTRGFQHSAQKTTPQAIDSAKQGAEQRREDRDASDRGPRGR